MCPRLPADVRCPARRPRPRRALPERRPAADSLRTADPSSTASTSWLISLLLKADADADTPERNRPPVAVPCCVVLVTPRAAAPVAADPGGCPSRRFTTVSTYGSSGEVRTVGSSNTTPPRRSSIFGGTAAGGTARAGGETCDGEGTAVPESAAEAGSRRRQRPETTKSLGDLAADGLLAAKAGKLPPEVAVLLLFPSRLRPIVGPDSVAAHSADDDARGSRTDNPGPSGPHCGDG